MTRERSELPWTKREIIDAVISQYEPLDEKKWQSWTFYILIRAFAILALGRPEGRAAPYIEHALWQRLRRRIHSHICSVAYPVLDAAGEFAERGSAESGPI